LGAVGSETAVGFGSATVSLGSSSESASSVSLV
jgi:hypothetical protein